MANKFSHDGDKDSFDLNWKSRKEALYTHWTSSLPCNQIQLAFRSHWHVFSDLIKRHGCGTQSVLEVGCGRGSLSSYFADSGWDCTLLDYSQSVLNIASSIFDNNNHKANFVQGDANNLPFGSSTFDFVFSIGLLEHFENFETVIDEQMRVLKPNGLMVAYVVPEHPDNIQKHFSWINIILKYLSGFRVSSSNIPKPPVYRSDSLSADYLNSLSFNGYQCVDTFGMYPLPMISHSPDFPFSLMHPLAEFVLSNIFRCVLLIRSVIFRTNGWICLERTGQAFALVFKKNS